MYSLLKGRSATLTAVAFFGSILCASASQASERFFPARENGVPGSYGVTLLRPVASSTPELLVGTVGGRLGYVYRFVLNGFEAELSENQAERLARHPLVKSVVQETYLHDQVSYTLPHCYEGFDTNTRALPPLPGPGNPVPQQTLDCADPAPGGDCIDNWGVDRIDQYGLPRDEEFNYRQASGNVKVFVVDRGVARDNREFDDASGTSRVDRGIDTNCANFPTGCNPGDAPCENQFDTGKGHGTHVAAIIGGRTFGLARDVEIVPIKALCPGYTTTHFKRALDWILTQHLASAPETAIVNLSGLNVACYADLGCSSGAQLREAVINVASRNNILFVQSAGNLSTDLALADACDYSFGDEDRYSDPDDVAAIARIVVAGGSDENDGLWRSETGDFGHPIGSTVGECVDIFSPAAHIVSAFFPLDPGSSDPDEIVCQLSGTSMAAPHVSGVAAMILQNTPTMNSAALRTMILNWAERDALESNPTDPNYIGAGSPNLLLHWDPSDIARDGFETGDLRSWLVSP